MDECRLAGAGELPLLEGRHDLGERDGVVERAMRRARWNAELAREVAQLPTGRKEIACQGQCVELAHIERASQFLRNTLEDGEVEVVAVMCHVYIVAAERAKGGPDVVNRRRPTDVRIRNAVQCGGFWRNRPCRLDERRERIHDDAVAHT